MRHRLATALCGLLAAAFIPPVFAQQAADWQSLFNGQNLDGWTAKIRTFPVGENFANTFRVEDGLLTVAYDGYEEFDNRFGHLFYAEPFSHYRLRVEYRFIGQHAPGTEPWAYRNSGVMIHSPAPETMPPAQTFPISIEAQFLGGLGDGNPRPTANLCTPGTHVVFDGKWTDTHCINSTSRTFHGDQWVTMELLVLGNERVVHYINGEAVLDYGGLTTGGEYVDGHDPTLLPEGAALDSGYISLQSEGHPLQFRRVELLNLKGCMDSRSPRFRDYYMEPDPQDC